MKQPSYATRVKAVKESIELMHSMQPKTPATVTTIFGNLPRLAPLERFEVVELARFLLGMDDEEVTK